MFPDYFCVKEFLNLYVHVSGRVKVTYWFLSYVPTLRVRAENVLMMYILVLAVAACIHY